MNLTLTDLKLVALVAAGIPVMAGVAWLNVRFGAEWERVPLGFGSERTPEAKAADLAPSDADAPERERFSNQWAHVQARFVQSPKGAVAEANALVWFLMKTRGYLVSDVNQGIDDISWGHRRVVEDYRSACEVAARIDKHRVTTKELRTAMIQYHAVFDELIRVPQVERIEVA